MALDFTIKNLQTIKRTQKQVKAELGKKYVETIQPFIDVIEMVMKANNENKFSAVKRIKDDTSFMDRENAIPFFVAAMMEITEAKHFKGFEK